MQYDCHQFKEKTNEADSLLGGLLFMENQERIGGVADWEFDKWFLVFG